MQKSLRIVLILWVFFFGSCKEIKEKKVATKALTQAAESFFPVTEFIQGQLKEIEGLPVTPLKIEIEGAKHDSTWLKKTDLRSFADPFLHPEIDSSAMGQFFIGKSFLDQTINAFTFSYDAKTILPDSVKLTHWDVYVDPQKNNVIRIYMVKEDSADSRHITTQLTWQSGKWFSIRNIIQPPGKEPVIKEQIIKWDFDE